MTSNNDVRLSLFSKLLAVGRDSKEKPESFENLADALEIMAVFDGLKPAHLSSRSFHSESLTAELQSIASEFGLASLRTLVIQPFRHHSPRIPEAVLKAFDEQNARDRHLESQVLWIYRDPSTADPIQNAADGKICRSGVLGYPECCIRHDSELTARFLEQFIQGLVRKYDAHAQAELIRLLDENASVDEMDTSWAAADIQTSGRLYPYVKFNACPECLNDKNSPAAQVNRQMRDLAFSLSPAFGRDIWHSRYQTLSQDRTVQVSKNSPCPCGREEEYERCCGEVSD